MRNLGERKEKLYFKKHRKKRENLSVALRYGVVLPQSLVKRFNLIEKFKFKRKKDENTKF